MQDATLIGTLPYTPPYDWGWMFAFLSRRSVSHIEVCSPEGFMRTLSLAGRTGWVRISPGQEGASVWAGGDLVTAQKPVLACVRRLFDLDARPDDIMRHLDGLSRLRPGIRLPGSPSAFEFAVRAICEQQISTQAAVRLTGKLVARFGQPIATPHAGLDRLFPDAQTLARHSVEEIAAVGLPKTRAAALHTLAKRVAHHPLDLEKPHDIEAGIAALQALPGIGPWTAGYIALRGWSAPDIFLPTDAAVVKFFGGKRPQEIGALSEAFRPYRSYALLQIWEEGDRPADDRQ